MQLCVCVCVYEGVSIDWCSLCIVWSVHQHWKSFENSHQFNINWFKKASNKSYTYIDLILLIHLWELYPKWQANKSKIQCECGWQQVIAYSFVNCCNLNIPVTVTTAAIIIDMVSYVSLSHYFQLNALSPIMHDRQLFRKSTPVAKIANVSFKQFIMNCYEMLYYSLLLQVHMDTLNALLELKVSSVRFVYS